MFRRKVTAPDGRRWTLGRHWLPRRKRLGRADMSDIGPDWLDFPDADDLGIVGVIIAVVVTIVLTIFIALLLFNVIAIAIELLIVIVVALAGIIGRVVFRRPWIVFARTKDVVHEWPVVGYLNGRRRIQEISSQLALGTQLDPAPRDR
ncbi:MAG TPA: hypothetical protein VI300_28365 [Solirubrobacter sp.]